MDLYVGLVGEEPGWRAFLLREGKRHTIFQKDFLKTEVPRHREIVDELARKICKDLEIPFVR